MSQQKLSQRDSVMRPKTMFRVHYQTLVLLLCLPGSSTSGSTYKHLFLPVPRGSSALSGLQWLSCLPGLSQMWKGLLVL